MFYTDPIKNFESTYVLVQNSKKDLNLGHNKAKEVLVYSSSPKGGIQSQSFPSREKAAEFLNISPNLVRYHIDSRKPGGINGYYIFSKKLTDSELQDLIELSSQGKNSNIKVWVYDAKTLKLIKDSAFASMQKTADYFNINYRTVLRHLETKLATKQNGQLLYFFSSKLPEEVLILKINLLELKMLLLRFEYTKNP